MPTITSLKQHQPGLTVLFLPALFYKAKVSSVTGNVQPPISKFIQLQKGAVRPILQGIHKVRVHFKKTVTLIVFAIEIICKKDLIEENRYFLRFIEIIKISICPPSLAIQE